MDCLQALRQLQTTRALWNEIGAVRLLADVQALDMLAELHHDADAVAVT